MCSRVSLQLLEFWHTEFDELLLVDLPDATARQLDLEALKTKKQN